MPASFLVDLVGLTAPIEHSHHLLLPLLQKNPDPATAQISAEYRKKFERTQEAQEAATIMLIPEGSLVVHALFGAGPDAHLNVILSAGWNLTLLGTSEFNVATAVQEGATSSAFPRGRFVDLRRRWSGNGSMPWRTMSYQPSEPSFDRGRPRNFSRLRHADHRGQHFAWVVAAEHRLRSSRRAKRNDHRVAV